MPHADVALTPDIGGVLPVRSVRAVVHPDVVGVRRAVDLGDLDPDPGGARLIPLLDLVREDGCAIGIDEADVLPEVFRIGVVDPRAVELDQDREVDEVLGLNDVIEGDLSPSAPRLVPP